ncbi:MAG: UvrD-helicase domain-containing protein [Proteobacteria bacterium]|nr:UvrD-helicase domain-containing protein [Candidatus Enterousia scatequi]
MKLNLENLNSEQIDAVNAVDDGPVLVTAGAGTGKTSVLLAVITHLLSNGVAPWNILAMTFTNKAANEIRDRVRSETGQNLSWMGTFHSVCLRILRIHADKLGLRPDFIIYDEDNQSKVIKSVLSTTTTSPAEYVEQFSRIKDGGLAALSSDNKNFQSYNAEMERLGALDFGDIILYVLRLFTEHPEILRAYQNQFKYILVDEFQDTNVAQMEFIKLLTRDAENPHIYCVGDEDQSIYSWRGAEIRNIVDFKQTYPNATIKKLQTNYRSTGNILGAANALISHNDDRYAKVLHTPDDSNMGEPVYVITVPSDLDEVRMISDEILSGRSEYQDIAILIRSATLSRSFETEFAQRHIPYRIIGAQKFYDRAEIRDAVAYLQLLVHPFDDMSFMRVVGKPSRGIGPAAIAKIKAAGANLMDGLRNSILSKKQRAMADEFLSAFDFDWGAMKPSDAASEVLKRSGYIKMWQDSADPDASDRIGNIKDLITSISKYETLPEFLEQASLMMTDDMDGTNVASDVGAVSIMTMHAAKGLEFDTVFLPAWEETIFPNEKSVNEGSLAEERRLAYVAITRAKRCAIITNAMSRFIYGSRQYNMPSRFISEMDSKFVRFIGGAHSQRVPTHTTPKPKFKQSTLVGKMVSHSDLGMGVVIEEGSGILTIAFKNKGIKKVARDFVKIL